MVSKELFTYHVKKALEGYYDAASLQLSPLIDLLNLVSALGETRIACLRRLLRETIEALKPPSSIPYNEQAWVGYRVLWSRYIQSRSQFAICEELGLSRTSYYRYLAEAIDAVSAILWDRYIALTPTEDRPNTIRPTDTGPIERAVRLSGYSSLQATRLAEIAEIIDDVLRIISPLENQCGITIRVSLPTQFPDTYYLSAGIVRQVLLIVLTEAIQIACNDVVNLIVAASKSEIAWRITQLRSDLLVSMDARVASNMAAAQALLAAHNGRLWSERDERKCFTLGFALPVCHPRTVLIVDDDPDTVELYTRYLRTGPYLVRTARTAQDVRKLLAQDLPDLVVLDVLLPGEDGWNILQQLKTMPETAHIPIIVCSVLSQPLLALALGAKEVLRKPVEQGTFLRAVSAALNLPEVPG